MTSLDHDRFTSLWQTGSSKCVVLPLLDDGKYDFSVDWGDGGARQHVQTWREAKHEYSRPGQYSIEITGTLNGFSFGKGDRKSAGKLLHIPQWGCLRLGNSGGYFHGCCNLQSIACVPDLTGVQNMSDMFSGASSFNGDISGWDTAQVKNMRYMFLGASSFNGDISGWDTAQVEDMMNMLTESKLGLEGGQVFLCCVQATC